MLVLSLPRRSDHPIAMDEYLIPIPQASLLSHSQISLILRDEKDRYAHISNSLQEVNIHFLSRIRSRYLHSICPPDI